MITTRGDNRAATDSLQIKQGSLFVMDFVAARKRKRKKEENIW